MPVNRNRILPHLRTVPYGVSVRPTPLGAAGKQALASGRPIKGWLIMDFSTNGDGTPTSSSNSRKLSKRKSTNHHRTFRSKNFRSGPCRSCNVKTTAHWREGGRNSKLIAPCNSLCDVHTSITTQLVSIWLDAADTSSIQACG